MTRYLVTGGAGFIGSHLVEMLLTHKETKAVKVLDNLSTGNLDNLASVLTDITFINGDLTEIDQVHQATKDVDIIFHLAAQVSVPLSVSDPITTNQANTIGTLNLLETARANGVKRIVLSSTCAIYGDEQTLPKQEQMAALPQSPYAVSKLAAEGYCFNYMAYHDIEAVVLRYFNVYGPRQSPSSSYAGVISLFIDRLQTGRPVTIFGDGGQSRDFVYVSDVVQANFMAAHSEKAPGHIFNIGTEKPTTISALYSMIAQTLGVNQPPTFAEPRPGDVYHSYADTNLAGNHLAWEASVPLSEGLAYTIEALNQTKLSIPK
ncbi:MAG: SDR family oxidoreductase [Chloroflexota bacterium]